MIPSIIANHQKRELETQFAKSYRTLNQMTSMAIAQHGNFDSWDWKNSYTKEEKDAFAKKYFIPYLNVMKFCPSDKSNGYCFLPHEKYDGAFDSKMVYYPNQTVSPQVILADGTSITFALRDNDCIKNGGICIVMGVDINGWKKPNTVGRDMFTFHIFPQINSFAPEGMYKDYINFEKKSIDEIRSDTNHWNLATRVVIDGFKINY